VRLLYYVTAAGANPVASYIEGLEKRERAHVFAALKDIAADGLEGGLTSYRPIDGKLWELRIGRQRIFYILRLGPEMILLHGYTKQSQKAPRREIEVAQARMKEVLGRERESGDRRTTR
jgi:phage-related protein